MRQVIYLFFLGSILISQNSVNIIESEKIQYTSIDNQKCQKLSGNILIEYNNMQIKIDTAIIFEKSKLITGWGNANIYNDSIFISCDSVSVRRNEETIIFYNNIILKKDTVNINANYMEYNYEGGWITYNNGGTFKTNQLSIHSDILNYNIKTEEAHFIKNVTCNNTEYNIFSKHLITLDNIIYFEDSSKVELTDKTIYFNRGKKDNNKNTEVLYNVKVIDSNQIIKSDLLNRDITNNISYFNKNISIKIDSTINIYGDKLKQTLNQYLITKNCKISLMSSQDSIIITGDSIKINSRDDVEIIRNIQIKGEEISGQCNNMLFLNEKNIIEMIDKPVLIFKNTKLYGEKIILFNNQNELDSIYIPSKPFILSKLDSINFYNQTKGKILEGKILKNKIELLRINGNTEMKHFQTLKSKNMLGLNNIISSGIEIQLHNNSISNVKCINKIDSHYFEFNTKKAKTMDYNTLYIEGFKDEYIE